MITELGKFLRGLRQANSELLKDMADKLEVSAAFLSAVESGKKNMPAAWEAELVRLYRLAAEQQKGLRVAIDQSQKSALIDLANQGSDRRSIAVAFARQFNGLSDAQLEAIKKTLAGHKNIAKD